MQGDPLVAYSSFMTQLGNLAANVSEPAVRAVGPALDAIASGLGNLSGAVAQFNKDHPTLAPIAEGAGAAVAAGGAGVASWYALRGTLGLFGRMAGLGGGEAAGGAVAAGEAGGIAGAAGGEAGAAVGAIGAAGAALPVLGIAVAALGSGALLIYGADTSKAIVHGGRPDDDVTMSEMLPGVSDEDRQISSNAHPTQPAPPKPFSQPEPIQVAPPAPAPLPAFATMARVGPASAAGPYQPPPPTRAGPDFTLGRYDHEFSEAPTDDTPTGTFRPTSRRRAMKIAEGYPETPAVPSLPPAPVMAPPPQQVDVAVTVGDPKFDGNLRVVVEPSQWLVGKIDFLSKQFSMGPSTAAIAKPSTGPSAEYAGLAQHVARRDE